MKNRWMLAGLAAIGLWACEGVTGRDLAANATTTDGGGLQCQTALGCVEGQICVDGDCAESVPCGSSGVGCSPRQVCDDGTCKPSDAIAPPSCRVNTDCPAGQDCQQSACQPRRAAGF